MTGMKREISMEELPLRKVERQEAGESSKENDQPVIVAEEIQEIGSTSIKEEKFKKLKEAQTKVQLGPTPKIQEVLLLRGHKHYQKYCEPRVVSLGPIHHGKPKYKLTEEYKLMLADKFIGGTGRTVEELYGIIEDNIKELREYYDEKVTLEYSDEDLAWMLFVDGCATLQFIDSLVNETVKAFKIKKDQVAFVQQDLFLLENQLPYQLLDYLMTNSEKQENLRESIQTFIDKQSMLAGGTKSPNADKKAIHLLDLLRKRLLGLDGVEDESALKNATDKKARIAYPVPDKNEENETDKEEDGSTEEDKSGKTPLTPTMESTMDERDLEWQTLQELGEARMAGGGRMVPDKNEENDEKDLEWQTLQELGEAGIAGGGRMAYPVARVQMARMVLDMSEENDERDLEWPTLQELGEAGIAGGGRMVPDMNEENDERDLEWQTFRNVQELREVGIHLKPRKSSHLGEIEFKKKWNFYPGILWMPKITVDDSTGPKFFNLIAYEMCPDFENDFGITSYICFLDSLIDDPKDVIDLRNAGILLNLLGSDQEVAEVFNEIGTDLVPNLGIYREVRVQIEKYYKMRSMTWISQVIHTHFSSPWTVIAFLAAFFALCLSVVQTVYSILAYYKG